MIQLHKKVSNNQKQYTQRIKMIYHLFINRNNKKKTKKFKLILNIKILI
jgi:hypothetical protein